MQSLKNLFLLLIFSGSFTLFAQKESSFKEIKENMFVGGNFGLSFTMHTSYLEVSPLAGYKLSENFGAGVGMNYQYFKNKFYNYNTNIIGPNVFARYYLFDWFFAHAQYERLFLKVKERDALGNEYFYKNSIPAFLGGAGLSSQMGVNSSFYGMLLYNFIDRPTNPYSNPVIRVGFIIGL